MFKCFLPSHHDLTMHRMSLLHHSAPWAPPLCQTKWEWPRAGDARGKSPPGLAPAPSHCALRPCAAFLTRGKAAGSALPLPTHSPGLCRALCARGGLDSQNEAFRVWSEGKQREDRDPWNHLEQKTLKSVKQWQQRKGTTARGFWHQLKSHSWCLWWMGPGWQPRAPHTHPVHKPVPHTSLSVKSRLPSEDDSISSSTWWSVSLQAGLDCSYILWVPVLQHPCVPAARGAGSCGRQWISRHASQHKQGFIPMDPLQQLVLQEPILPTSAPGAAAPQGPLCSAPGTCSPSGGPADLRL